MDQSGRGDKSSSARAVQLERELFAKNPFVEGVAFIEEHGHRLAAVLADDHMGDVAHFLRVG
jgi:hypothetical protein